MNHKNILFFIFVFFFSLGLSPREKLFQVITSHPEDLSALNPHIETVHQSGRLWIVRVKDQFPPKLIPFLRPLRGGEKSYTDFETLPLTSNEVIKNFVQRIDPNVIKRDVLKLSSYRTRKAGTSDNQEAVKFVSSRFHEMGYEHYDSCYAKSICSVVAEKKGTHTPNKVIMVMAHIDSVGKSFAGADDNASGTAVLLEMARVLQDYPSHKTIRFLVTNGEEDGLLGATHYVRALEKENKLRELDLVINMDMVGYNSNGIVELETEPEYQNLAKWFASLATQYTRLKSKITLGAWGSDHVPFLKRQVPAVLTIEDWDTKTPCYHQSCDTPDTLNYEYASEIGKLNLAAVMEKVY